MGITGGNPEKSLYTGLGHLYVVYRDCEMGGIHARRSPKNPEEHLFKISNRRTLLLNNDLEERL